MDKKANFFNIENLLNAVPSPSGHVLRAVTIKMPHGRSLFPPFGKNFKQAAYQGLSFQPTTKPMAKHHIAADVGLSSANRFK
jgi:hypothetical protein